MDSRHLRPGSEEGPVSLLILGCTALPCIQCSPHCGVPSADHLGLGLGVGAKVRGPSYGVWTLELGVHLCFGGHGSEIGIWGLGTGVGV